MTVAASSADDGATELAVLVCSANVGNEEPTPESFGEWVPDDGGVNGPLSQTKYPVEWQGADAVRSSLSGRPRKFDLIVLGMQEAAFIDKTKSGRFSKAAMKEHLQNFEELDVVLGLTDTMAKTALVATGLTASKTYTSPSHGGVLSKSKPAWANRIVSTGAPDKPTLSSSRYDTQRFLDLIGCRLPSYTIVASKLRGEMRLIVMALDGLAREITDVQIAAENTGIGSVLANKGGIILTFTLRGNRFSFMTAHLEAHEGKTHYENRNKNLAEIFEGAKKGSSNITELFDGAKKAPINHRLYDAAVISHHMFVCGDLNYRIKFGDHQQAIKPKRRTLKSGLLRKGVELTGIPESKTSPAPPSAVFPDPVPPSPDVPPLTPAGIDVAVGNIDAFSAASPAKSSGGPEQSTLVKEGLDEAPDKGDQVKDEKANGAHFAQAMELIEAEDWEALNEGDELGMAMKNKECLVGFKTLPCHFPPTFKVERGKGYQYKEKRTPSYTDRILWKSAHGMEDDVVPFLHEPCPDFITSDHKPIRGGYMVKIKRGPSTQPPKRKGKIPSIKSSDRQVQIMVSDIKCTNLPAMDTAMQGGLSDPYIKFVSYPRHYLHKKAWPRTKVIKRNLNPVWKEDMQLTLDTDCGKEPSLHGSMFYMSVMDMDVGKDDDLIGTVALSLAELCSELNMEASEMSPKLSTKLSTKRFQVAEMQVQTTKISRPIIRNCQEFGMLECTITSAYLTSKESKAFFKLVGR